MTRHTHKLYVLKRAIFGVLMVLLLTGFYLVSAQLTTWRAASASSPVNQLTKELLCAPKDPVYCALIRRLVPAVEAGDFSQLLANQLAASVMCPNPITGSYCNGVPVALFTVYQDGQPKLMMRNDYIAFFRSYLASTGKLTYLAPKTGVQNPLLFRTQRGVVRLELQLQQTPGGGWQFVWPTANR